MFNLTTRHLRGDIFGGITAGVVALPLALAMGVASGLGPIAGLYGAIFVGFFAALFGGTESQVSGPTGPMTVVVAGVVASIAIHPDLSGNIELIFTTIILAGVFQILFGVFKLGDYISLVPYPVISGFMSGIGGIIIILQISPLLGQVAPAGTLGALMYAPTALGNMNIAALGLGFLTLLIAMKWPANLAKFLPGPLAALIIGTLISVFLGTVPILGEIPTGLPELHLPVFSPESFLIIAEAALVLAVLGSIDSLLTSLVADNMTRTRHQSNKELIGQGIGNAVAGLFGGAPGAGATMRTVVNIRTGGKTRISGMVHAILLLAVVLGMGPLASYIPHAVLAGILVKVGLDIIDWSYIKNSHRGPRWDLVLMIIVVGLTIFVDLMTAVAAGVVLASLAFVKQVASQQMERIKATDLVRHTATPRELEIMNEAGDLMTIFDFSGPLSFGAAADLGHHARSQLQGGTLAIVLDFSRVPFLDVSAALAVETIANDAEHTNRRLYMCGMNEEVRKVLSALEADEHLHDAHHFETREQAMEAAIQGIKEMQSGYTQTKNH
ncbi:MAG: SulP family inorganic anion transporter [Gammaproteobacteria bacterium]|nr:SulP family inorganic anion transporter [Gammaproteobacteria bacterium]